MKVSFIAAPGNITLSNGYGIAGFNLISSIQRIGHKVPFADPTAPVEIAFCQPDFSSWSNPDAYHIQYTPWESTEIRPGWIEAFNETCDEVWTTSSMIAQWYKEAGVIKPIYVYEHGVESIWTPKRRRRNDRLNILHVGEPADRKGGSDAVEVFHEVFGNRTDVHLTIKAWIRSNIRIMKGDNIIGLPHTVYKNMTTIYEEINQNQMVQIYHDHDAMVYPSWGEGFGLIPLQALATGMPTICTEAWAPYANFLHPSLAIGSEIVESPWPNTHPGKMFKPSRDDLAKAYTALDENFDKLAGQAIKMSFYVRSYYDWDKLTLEAFSRIFKKFS